MGARQELISARKAKGYTQQKLADIIGIDRAYLTNIERGKYTPSLQVAKNLATALDKDIEHLFFSINVRKTNN